MEKILINEEMKKLLKGQLKESSLLIRKTRGELKEMQRRNAEHYAHLAKLSTMITNYRHLHIAYSMLNGNSYEQIENKCRPGNEPSWFEINKHISDCTQED